MADSCPECGFAPGMHAWNCMQALADVGVPTPGPRVLSLVPAELEERCPLTRPQQQEQLEAIGRLLLTTLGEDPEREGLRETPRRWARWWLDFVHHDAGRMATTFASPGTDQVVGIRGVRVWSLCEHHLLPFWCDLTMAYVASDKVLGLSKFARIAQHYAHRLQLQEQLVEQIASHLVEATGSQDVAVLAEGEHLCLTMRGAKAEEARMQCSVLRGRFRSEARVRQEWMHLARGSSS